MVCATAHLADGSCDRTEGKEKVRSDWLQGILDDLQYGKLARPDNEDGREHEPNAGGKHRRGRK